MSKKELQGGIANAMLPAVSQTYRPTETQWEKIVTETEFSAELISPFSRIELINFKTSKLHLKGGNRIPFDGLSEHQYIHVINGGFYEEAPSIDNTARI